MNMNSPLSFVFFIHLLSFWQQCESSISCDLQPKNTEARLQQQLLCRYDKSIRPVGDSRNKTMVRVRMFVKSFDYDDAYGKITINSWLSLRWKDEHLKWNSKEFDNIESVNIHSDDIWMPDLALYNSKSTQYTEICTAAHCIVYKTGTVSCIPPCSHEAFCKSDYTYWPFDTQNCSLHLGSWVHKGEEIDYQPVTTGIEKSKVLHKEWKIISTFVKKNPGNYSCCPNETYPSLRYNFVIERHSASEKAFIVAPAVILVSLNLITLWLNPACSERLLISIVSIFSHFIFIQQLSWVVPKNGDIAPNAIIFFRDSLVISTILLLNTLITRGLMSCKCAIPAWLQSTMETLKSNKLGNAIFSKPYLIERTPLNNESATDDSTNLVEGGGSTGNVQQTVDAEKPEANSSNLWIVAVRIIDILLFLILVAVYFIMFVGWIPESYKDVGTLNAELLDEDV